MNKDKDLDRKIKELWANPNLTDEEKFAKMLVDPEWRANFKAARDHALEESRKIARQKEKEYWQEIAKLEHESRIIEGIEKAKRLQDYWELFFLIAIILSILFCFLLGLTF